MLITLKGGKMMKKFLTSVFISLCIMFGIYFPTFAESTQASIVDLSSVVGKATSYASADFNGDELLLLSYQCQKDTYTYYLTIYNTKTSKVRINHKKLDKKFCALDDIYGAQYQSNGQILIYGVDYKKNYVSVGKGILYNASLKQIKKINYTEPDSGDYTKKSSLITTRFCGEKEYAFNYDSEGLYQYLVFYDTPKYIYIEKDAKNLCQINYKKKMLTCKYSSKGNKNYLNFTVKDYNKGVCINRITISPQKKNSIMSLVRSCMNGKYACLIVEEYKDEKTTVTPYLWDYTQNSSNTKLNVKKLTQSGLSKENTTLIQNIKTKYGIHIYNKSIKSDVGEGEQCEKASPISLYIVLTTMQEALKLFPEGFFKELCQSDPNWKSCDIYMVEDIPGNTAGYVRYSDCAMVLGARVFTNSVLVHEFMHQMDIQIYAYYEKQNQDFSDMWNALNPKSFTYGENQSFNEKYFVSGYAMTSANEDRADLFMYLFYSDEYYHAWDKYPTLAKKAKFLSDSIRKAFPSVQSVKQTVWEKDVPKVVLDQGKITDLTKTSNGIKIQWKKISNAGGYYIYRQTGGKGGYKKIATIQKGSILTYTDKKVKNGIKYQYKVKAFKGKVTGNSSAAKETYYMQQPVIVSSKTTSKGILVKWKKNTEATGYEIRYRMASGKYTTLVIVSNDTVKWTIGNLKKNKSYQVSMRTYKKVNGTRYISAWSKPVSN
jgi:hypothetical protein